VDLDSFLVSLYVLVDDWWKKRHRSSPRKPGRPALLSDSEVGFSEVRIQDPE
jgi:hypothetical protein